MARADTDTLLCIDDWARLMAVHPDAWNQVIYPAAPYPGACERTWLQHGWLDQTSGRITGREDVAQAIATAEEMIAHALGFWPAPMWTRAEPHQWPRPARGLQTAYPPIQLDWGYVIEGGKRGLDAIDLANVPVYSASILGGVLDTATITITAADMTAAEASPEEVAVYFAGETDDIWRIRCLSVTEDPLTGDVTVVGRRSQFVDPDLWLEADDIDITVNANFVATVDVYRRYNDTSEQAQVVWKGSGASCSTAICAETCQDACLSIDDSRNSIVRVLPGTYAAGVWTGAAFSQGYLPDAAKIWYYSGTLLQPNGRIKPLMAEAIVRLANTYMVDQPCGCDQTMHRWQRDREEQDITTVDVALCLSAFGTTMRGAMFAWSVIKRIPPVQKGGALT